MSDAPESLHPRSTGGQTQPPANAPQRRASLAIFGWVCAVLFAVFGSVGAVGVLAQSTGYAASIPLARFIALTYTEAATESGQQITIREPLQWNVVGLRWWDIEGRDQVLNILAWNRLAEPIVLTDLFWLLAICPPFAVFWRTIFAASSRKTMIFWFAGGAFLGAIVLWAYLASPPYGLIVGQGNYAIYIAEAHVGVYVLWSSYVIGLVALALSIWLARPALRLIIRSLGGPRLRAWADPLFAR